MGSRNVRERYKNTCRLVACGQLRGVKKVALESGEETAVSFSLGLKDFGFYLEDGTFILEKGDFDIYIGDSSIYKNKMRISIK